VLVVAAAGFGLTACGGSRATGGARHSSTSSSTSVSSSTTSTSSTTTTTTSPYPAATPVPIFPGPIAPVIAKVPTPNRVVFFTIDDGFVQDPAVIDFLRAHHLPVTMFVLPGAVNQNPGYFQAIRALGASVQDHTVHHPNLERLSYEGQVQEICGSLDGFTMLFAQRPWLFRPPYGAYNQATLRAARACGLQAVITWDGTMNDGVLRLQHPGGLQPGDIILMHFRPDLLQNLKNLSGAAYLSGVQPAPLEQYLPPPLGQ